MTHAEVQAEIDKDIAAISAMVYAARKPPIDLKNGETYWDALGRRDQEDMAKGDTTAVVFHRFYENFGPGQLVRTSFIAAQALINWLGVARAATEQDLKPAAEDG